MMGFVTVDVKVEIFVPDLAFYYLLLNTDGDFQVRQNISFANTMLD